MQNDIKIDLGAVLSNPVESDNWIEQEKALRKELDAMRMLLQKEEFKNISNIILEKIFEIASVCQCCGKKKCPSPNRILPEKIKREDILKAFELPEE